ncbi:MAG: hypothetical protein HQ581_18620, partial [Planctomycetes bacterium]|nr:hypothetical protein [Planctomycetota bacterium]
MRIASRGLLAVVVAVGTCHAGAAESAAPGRTTTTAVSLDLDAEWAFQFDQLRRRIELREKLFPQRVRETVFRTDALILATDRDPADVVVRRTSALLEDLSRSADGVDFAVEKQALDQFRRQVLTVAITDAAARKELYQEACSLRRRISFKNPLLNFDKILFV